jgi:hypothetical protein
VSGQFGGYFTLWQGGIPPKCDWKPIGLRVVYFGSFRH